MFILWHNYLIPKGVTKPFYQERWSKEIGFMPNGSAAELREELTASVRRHIMSEVYMATLLLDIGNPDFA